MAYRDMTENFETFGNWLVPDNGTRDICICFPRESQGILSSEGPGFLIAEYDSSPCKLRRVYSVMRKEIRGPKRMSVLYA